MMLKIYGAVMRSLILFAAIQALAYFLGSSDTAAISIMVLGIAVVLFVLAYLSAFRKDKRDKKNIVDAVLEVQ